MSADPTEVRQTYVANFEAALAGVSRAEQILADSKVTASDAEMRLYAYDKGVAEGRKIADAERRPAPISPRRQIGTAEDLDALPYEAVVREVRADGLPDAFVFEKRGGVQADTRWAICTRTPAPGQVVRDKPDLPVIVLFDPREETTR